MPEANRIDVASARREVTEGNALLVCGYEDENKCRQIMLDGAISFGAFRNQLASTPKDREIIFYCA